MSGHEQKTKRKYFICSKDGQTITHTPWVAHCILLMTIVMPSNMQMSLIELKANSVFKMKFYELHSFPRASEIIGFWRSLSCENFPDMRKFAQSHPASSELRRDASCHFRPWKWSKTNWGRDCPIPTWKTVCCFQLRINSWYYWFGESIDESIVTLKSFMFILPVYKIIFI